jgi:hypothetical protein
MKHILLMAVIAAVSAMISAPAAHAVDFRTPNKAAYCDFVPEDEIVDGGVTNPRTDDMFCWTPHDGFTVQMTVRGRAQEVAGSGSRLEGAYAPVNRLLRFGQRWRRSGFSCVSRWSGLTCVNRARHGWWLGRFMGSRLF